MDSFFNSNSYIENIFVIVRDPYIFRILVMCGINDAIVFYAFEVTRKEVYFGKILSVDEDDTLISI